MISEEKQRLREDIRKNLSMRSPEEIRVASRKMRVLLNSWAMWKKAHIACVFSALPGEPDLLDPWPKDKILLFPRIEDSGLSLRIVTARDELVRGAFGIWEPGEKVAQAEIMPDIILVPGLAFDRGGGRLGRGRGYYDRLLACKAGFRLGVCFEDQVYSKVPQESHDHAMHALLTPQGISLCEGKNTPAS